MDHPKLYCHISVEKMYNYNIMSPLFFGLSVVVIYLIINNFFSFSFITHCYFGGISFVYFLLLYLNNYQPEILVKMINAMKKVNSQPTSLDKKK